MNYVHSKNGINIDGIPLTCDWADVVDEEDNNSKQVFIAGLNDTISDDYVKDIFLKFGDVTEILFSRNHKNSKRKDLAFVTYSTHSEAKNAVEQCKLNKYFDEPITINLSFSSQSMHSKKKSKDQRRRPSFTSHYKDQFNPSSRSQSQVSQISQSNLSNPSLVGNMQNNALLNTLLNSINNVRVIIAII